MYDTETETDTDTDKMDTEANENLEIVQTFPQNSTHKPTFIGLCTDIGIRQFEHGIAQGRAH